MGVYIDGMEMPRNEPLLIKLNPDGSVSTTAKNGYRKYAAIPVPSLGDLIGREWLIDIALHLMHAAKNDEIANGVKWLLQHIIEAPTIIKAEEDE